MADLTITVANVGVMGDAQLQVVPLGESVTEGQPGYQATDNLWYQADANASAAAAKATGIYITSGTTFAVIAFRGKVNVGATLTVGETYFVSANKGKIAPAADVTTGWYPRLLGQASAANTLELAPSGGETARA